MIFSGLAEKQRRANFGCVRFFFIMEVRRDLDDEFVHRVGAWKVRYSISYAAAFALALAEREGVPLITTDHHEFDSVEADGTVDFFWLR